MKIGEPEDIGIPVKARCFAHELREVADTIKRNPGLMTEESPYDAALLLRMDLDAIEGGYYDPDPGDFDSDAEE